MFVRVGPISGCTYVESCESSQSSVTGDMSQLSVLDPENMGLVIHMCIHAIPTVTILYDRFVGVEELAQQWQTMGVEAPHNTSLEDVLKEVMVELSLAICRELFNGCFVSLYQ